MTYHCPIHDLNYTGNECPRCDAEARHKKAIALSQERHDEAITAIRESDYRRSNPGDYKCPQCFYVSLKRGSFKCPLCHSEIGREFWNSIYIAEAKQAEIDRLNRIKQEQEIADEIKYIIAKKAEEKKNVIIKTVLLVLSVIAALIFSPIVCSNNTTKPTANHNTNKSYSPVTSVDKIMLNPGERSDHIPVGAYGIYFECFVPYEARVWLDDDQGIWTQSPYTDVNGWYLVHSNAPHYARIKSVSRGLQVTQVQFRIQHTAKLRVDGIDKTVLCSPGEIHYRVKNRP